MLRLPHLKGVVVAFAHFKGVVVAFAHLKGVVAVPRTPFLTLKVLWLPLFKLINENSPQKKKKKIHLKKKAHLKVVVVSFAHLKGVVAVPGTPEVADGAPEQGVPVPDHSHVGAHVRETSEQRVAAVWGERRRCILYIFI